MVLTQTFRIYFALAKNTFFNVKIPFPMTSTTLPPAIMFFAETFLRNAYHRNPTYIFSLKSPVGAFWNQSRLVHKNSPAISILSREKYRWFYSSRKSSSSFSNSRSIRSRSNSSSDISSPIANPKPKISTKIKIHKYHLPFLISALRAYNL